MTREEAINELKILREEYWNDDGYGHETQQYDDTITALDMAIKALEQQESDDKISKIKSEYLVMDEYGYTDKELVDTVNMLVDKVNELNALIQHKSRK